jgi:hypothetical protein
MVGEQWHTVEAVAVAVAVDQQYNQIMVAK